MADNSLSTSAEDFVAVQQRYTEERNKRLRPEGVSQYVDLSTSEYFRRFQDDPWITPNSSEGPTALEDGDRCGFMILGCGFGGLLFAVRLIQNGIPASQIRMVDIAGGYGGAWYWNRYPGLMCDCESYVYLPLLEETGYMPKNKYASGPEIREYAESIADKYQLRDKTQFQTKVENFEWDDNKGEWIVKLTKQPNSNNESHITVRSRFTMSSPGILNNPKMSNLPGLESFQGPIFHTSRWDYNVTGGSPTDYSFINLKDKRVGIIGTGATAVQSIPHLAEWSKDLYVFQRTPSSVDRRDNRPTDPKLWVEDIANKKGWHKERAENFNAHISNVTPKPTVDMVADAWSNAPTFSGLVGGPASVTPDKIPEYIASLHTLDFHASKGCTFNRPNVHLVDTDGNGVTSITENGIPVDGKLYELDVLIFSTGFRPPGIGTPATRANMKVIGRNGQSLDQKFDEAIGTLHGIISRDFPNFFFIGPQSAATANFMFAIDALVTHAAAIVSTAAKRVYRDDKYNFTVEPTTEAEENWAMQVMTHAASLAGVAGCTPSYFNKEGEIDRVQSIDERMKAARGAIWGKGIADFVNVIENWRRDGELKGLEVIPVP
ncbi:hypothetical protein B7463_g8218, partial [Scytalidium lignicola]